MLVINDDIALGDDEIDLSFIRAGGPGGQNVNKVSTAVQLRFRAEASPSLVPPVKSRLKRIAGSKWTREGEIVLTANRYRTQEQNRQDAHDRLREMILEALKRPKFRVPTRPTKASKERRLKAKTTRSGIKKMRSGKISRDE